MPPLRIVDRGTLLTAVAAWLNRSDDTELQDYLPTMLQLAEAQFDRDIAWRHMVVRDTTTADQRIEQLPDDFQELISIHFPGDPLVIPEYVTLDQLDKIRAANSGLSGTPRYYSIVGNNLHFDRTPGAPGVAMELVSRVQVPPLSGAADNQGNRLLEEHPDIYLFGTLLQAEAYLKNDERLTVWGTLYGAATAGLRKKDRKVKHGPGPLVIRSRRRF